MQQELEEKTYKEEQEKLKQQAEEELKFQQQRQQDEEKKLEFERQKKAKELEWEHKLLQNSQNKLAEQEHKEPEIKLIRSLYFIVMYYLI